MPSKSGCQRSLRNPCILQKGKGFLRHATPHVMAFSGGASVFANMESRSPGVGFIELVFNGHKAHVR